MSAANPTHTQQLATQEVDAKEARRRMKELCFNVLLAAL